MRVAPACPAAELNTLPSAHAAPSPAQAADTSHTYDSAPAHTSTQSDDTLTPRRQQSATLMRRAVSERPSTRANPSPFSLLLGRPTRVPRRVRSQRHRHGGEGRVRVELEAPREVLGRKTQAKAMKNRRYAAALQAFERSQDAQRHSLSGMDCSTPGTASTHQDSHQNTARGADSGERLAADSENCSPMCKPGLQSCAVSVPERSPLATMDVEGATNATFAMPDASFGKTRRLGIVNDVLANLRRDEDDYAAM